MALHQTKIKQSISHKDHATQQDGNKRSKHFTSL